MQSASYCPHWDGKRDGVRSPFQIIGESNCGEDESPRKDLKANEAVCKTMQIKFGRKNWIKTRVGLARSILITVAF
jgi:hypothetical protein